MGIGDRRRFRRDPYGYIEDLRRRSPSGVIPLPWGGWCVGDPDLARQVLRGAEFNDGASDFFGPLLPTRSAQVAVGHAVRDVLRAHAPQFRDRFAAGVADLSSASRWPTAGTRLVHRCLADLLLHPGTPAGTRRLLARAVTDGVVLRARRVWRRARAEVRRARLVTAVAAVVRDRREVLAGEPLDVLDAVVGTCPEETSDRAVAELFLVLFRSIIAPVGCSLAWAVLLVCLNHPAGPPWPWPVDAAVREALRHRPMAWMVGRTVPRPTEVGGLPFRPGDVLSVSPYLLHHDERHWTEPAAFRPERWAEPGGRGPYLPFGAGPFACAGASLARELTGLALAALGHDARLTVTGGDTRPVLADGAVPRPFVLHRAPARSADRTGRR
ncbi:cytochrome P450 [Actinosynnema sp. NPDC047251]|uniref:Cytochrome P450-like protein n=1 Tax=Saccharothrix espanaensis (strain ATCC 51144 / DSM 44229 / JCM 9112 / NBRC 15066 / NRRL 15764) TaxID=1179773 RepID=K0JYN1_SACES|nr:cytochrome P450 [Saccharothrix espanaensis]CCH31241.1 Cytochrome P450-like protein [Saccharothrix espanaensis DSM 44229]